MVTTGWLTLGWLAMLQAPLLDNGDFERLEGGKPAVWVFQGQGTPVEDAALAHSGRWLARVRFDDRGTQDVVGSAGNWYRITGVCRAENPATEETPRIKLYFLDADGRELVQGGGFIHGVDAEHWQPFEIAYTAPPGTATVKICLIGQFHGVDWFLFDDLAVEQVPVKDRPLLETVPDLHQKTLTPAPALDVKSYALYRIPPIATTPIDGDLTTAAWTGRSVNIEQHPATCDFDVTYSRPTTISWVILHAMNPLRPLGPAELTVGDQTVPIGEEGNFVHSLQFPATASDRLRLRVLNNDKRTAEVAEIQAFGVRDGADLPGATQLTFGAAPSEAERAEVAQRFQAPENQTLLVASPTGGEAANIELPKLRPVTLALRAGEGETGVTGVKLALALSPTAADELLEIAVKQVAELDLNLNWATWDARQIEQAKKVSPRRQSDLFRIYTRVPAGRTEPLELVLDLPDLVLPAGEPIFVELKTESDRTLDVARSSAAVKTVPVAEAKAEYLPQLEHLTRFLYADLTEAHPYDSRGFNYQDMAVYRYLAHLLELDPGNDAAERILSRIARRLPKVEVPRPGPADAPDWAVWGRHAAREWDGIAQWWLDNRWIESGELGGNLNDDVEYTCHWPLLYLITGDEQVAAAQRDLADAVWEQSGRTGYSIAATDVEHAAEDSSCSLPQMLLCEYGNPLHVERMMAMSRHIPFWTGINDQGRLHFKSYNFNTKFVDTGEKKDIDHLYCALAMIGPTHLSWYNDNPRTNEWVAEYARSWSELAMSTEKGKPEGKLPNEVKFSTGEIAPYTERWNLSVYFNAGHYVMEYFLLGAQRLGLDAGPMLDPAVGYIVGSEEQAKNRTEQVQALYEERQKQTAPYGEDGSWTTPAAEVEAYRTAVATGDLSYLTRALEEAAREFERSRWLLTEAEPFTDRIPTPANNLLKWMFLGGDVAGKSHVPGLAASWEGGGTDFAALVLAADRERLKVLVYNFNDAIGELGLRVWRLDPGSYRIRQGVDANSDGEFDAEPATETADLRRFSRVAVAAPSGQVRLIEIERVGDPATPLGTADLALAAEELQAVDGGWQATVHNVGTTDVTGATLRLVDGGGATLAEAPIPALAAPSDFEPKRVEVKLPNRPNGVALEVAVPGGDRVPENNRVALPAPR